MSLALAGCLRGGSASGPPDPSATSSSSLHAEVDAWASRYNAHPGEKSASLGYAHVLTALNETNQAAAVLQAAVVKSPRDREVLAAYGKALVDTGDYDQAMQVLSRAHSPDQPDWRILSAEGIASDGTGQHDRAQGFYLAALKIVPDEPGVLSISGCPMRCRASCPRLSVYCTGRAGPTRRSAGAAESGAGIALQGRFDMATQTLRHDLSPKDAAANVTEIRAMIAQTNTWDAIRGKNPAKPGLTTVSRAKPPGDATSPQQASE